MTNDETQQLALWIVSLSRVATSAAFLFVTNPALADSLVVPDDTLGSERSVMTDIDAVTQQIEGGATRGTNLFHSFLEFNVAEDPG